MSKMFTSLLASRDRFKEEHKSKTSKDDCRAMRFKLQSVAQAIYSKEKDADGKSEFKRQLGCLTWMHLQSLGVDVNHNTRTGRCSYAGLQRCGSVWACVPCSAFASEQRRSQLKRVVASHQAEHGEMSVVLITRTFSHKDYDTLGDLMSKLKTVEDSYKSGRWLGDFKRLYGVVGTVRALEITYGFNGFHPHIHELLLLDGDMLEEELDCLRDFILKRWESQLEHVGS